MNDRRKYVANLGEAHSYAQVYANQDNTPWNIWEYAGCLKILPAFEKKPYAEKLLETIMPGLITIQLTPDEAKHYQEYIETERGYPDGFQGGMYKTETEKSILGKIKAALVG